MGSCGGKLAGKMKRGLLALIKTMRELIPKTEARIVDRREELESWISSSQMVREVLNSEIAFLEALVVEMKAMRQ